MYLLLSVSLLSYILSENVKCSIQIIDKETCFFRELFCFFPIRRSVLMVQSSSNPYELGPGSGLATGGRIRRHSLRVHEEAVSHG